MLSAAGGGPSDISKTIKWTKLIVHDEDGQVEPAVPKYADPTAIAEDDEFITQEINGIKNFSDKSGPQPLLINHSDATTPRMSEK